MTNTPFLSASLMICLVRFSGIPSAMMAMERILKEINMHMKVYSITEIFDSIFQYV